MKKLLIFAVILFVFSCKNEKVEEQKKPNILFIVVDDQGYSDFTPFKINDANVATPNISRIGEKGRVYAQAYVTAPVCSPSRVGFLTGKNQFRWDKPASWGPGLPDNVKTLAGRAEDIGMNMDHREQYDMVVSRATAYFPTLLEYTLPLLKV